MSDIAILAEGLGKQYRLGGKPQGYRTLREVLADAFGRSLQPLRGGSHAAMTQDRELFWALKDVSFEVKCGAALGIVGRNGAGKSTLLKILARITEPTLGLADVWGRIGSLLEVGTGFHPELSGRENIFLNGAVLGMSRGEIVRKMDEIVAFAEIEKFLDTAVKHYSSGMYLRLAFAVAAHLEPEILLMDEVLAVGDAAFQKKCLGKMGAVASEGRTVLFVSHNISAIRELCTTALWIDKGHIAASGEVDEVIGKYLKSLTSGAFSYRNSEFEFAVGNVALRDSAGDRCHTFRPGEDMIVEIAYDALIPVEAPYFMLVVEGHSGNCFSANMLWDGHRPDRLYGRGVLRCRFRALPLLPQTYSVKMAIRAKDGRHNIVPLQDVVSFDVSARLEDYGLTGRFYAAASRATSVVVPYEWEMPDGTTAAIELKLPAEVARV